MILLPFCEKLMAVKFNPHRVVCVQNRNVDAFLTIPLNKSALITCMNLSYINNNTNSTAHMFSLHIKVNNNKRLQTIYKCHHRTAQQMEVPISSLENNHTQHLCIDTKI